MCTSAPGIVSKFSSYKCCLSLLFFVWMLCKNPGLLQKSKSQTERKGSINSSSSGFTSNFSEAALTLYSAVSTYSPSYPYSVHIIYWWSL